MLIFGLSIKFWIYFLLNFPKNILDTEVRLRSGGLGGVPNFVNWQEHLAQVQNSFGLTCDVISPDKLTALRFSPSNQSTFDRLGLVQALIDVADNILPRFLKVPDLVTSKKSIADSGDHQSNNGTLNNDGSQTDDSSSSDDGKEKGENDDIFLLDPGAHINRTQNWLNAWKTEVHQAKTLARLNLLHVSFF